MPTPFARQSARNHDHEEARRKAIRDAAHEQHGRVCPWEAPAPSVVGQRAVPTKAEAVEAYQEAVRREQ